MKFDFIISREVIISEYVTRTIEADSPEAAQAIADGIASDYNMNAPDDAKESDAAEYESWEASPAE